MLLIHHFQAAQQREKAEKAKNKHLEGLKSGAGSTAKSSPKGKKQVNDAQPSKPVQKKIQVDQQALDMSSLNLGPKEEEPVYEEPPKIALAREKVIEEAQKAIDLSTRKAVSLVVIGMASFNSMPSLKVNIDS